jgi:hypothetical protein
MVIGILLIYGAYTHEKETTTRKRLEIFGEIKERLK